MNFAEWRAAWRVVRQAKGDQTLIQVWFPFKYAALYAYAHR